MKRLPLLLTACALTTAAYGQTYGTICSETFEYATGGLGGGAGGTGWFSSWWSGGNGDDALVTTPGHDGTGEKCTTNFSNAGSYRSPETGPHPDLAPNFNFGSGDGVMWITFTAGRAAGTSDDYGGLSLHTQFGAEHLFIGAPYQAYEWGIVDSSNGNAATVPGSNIDQTTTLVVRIVYTQAGETVDLWVDPADAHPSTPSDASLVMGDFEWNEIRLQSGENQGGTTGFEFDGLLFEKELPSIGTNYCGPANPNSSGNPAVIAATGSNVAADNNLTLEAFDLPTGQFSMFVNSMSQGFVTPPGSAGNLCLSGQIGRHKQNIQNTGASGMVQLALDLNAVPTPGGPVIVQAGETWHWQLWFRDLGGVSNFTDGITITFQ